jgi:hypothetical protein
MKPPYLASFVLLLMFLGSPGATGQIIPSAFTCIANAGTPVIVHSEGITEQVGDIILQCTGGVPTAPGASPPTYDIGVAVF